MTTTPATTEQAPVLHVTGLTKTFGQDELQVTAVGGVDLDIGPGEVVLIMGPSGSGKTTLLLMLGAMLRPTHGAIQVDGLDLARAAERRLPALRARRFGFVFQDFSLLSALTALENVELACNLAGVTGQRARHRARALLERVGLGHRLGFRPEQLSGGEKQRVAIARALANDPPVILADEPTANLDSAIGRQVARLLRQLATEDHRAVAIVSHDARLEEIADRVLWLEDGGFRELAAMATDPVCGMTVAQHDHPHLQLDGTVWWFCSTACREEFAANPDKFAPSARRAAGPIPDRQAVTAGLGRSGPEHCGWMRVSVMLVSCGNSMQPAAQADERAGGPVDVPDPLQQPAPAAQRPGACQMGERLRLGVKVKEERVLDDLLADLARPESAME